MDKTGFGPKVPAADHHAHGSNQVIVSQSHSHSPPPYGPIKSINPYSCPTRKHRSSLERNRRSVSCLNVVPEERIVMEFSRSVEPCTPRYTGGAPLHGDEEVEEWELDEELEEQGLYRGSLRKFTHIYIVLI